MAVLTETFQTYASIGNREDLGDIIFDVSPHDTPFISTINKATATATFHEWQEDALAPMNTANAALQGDDAVIAAVVPTVRHGNRTQILTKAVSISGTEE